MKRQKTVFKVQKHRRHEHDTQYKVDIQTVRIQTFKILEKSTDKTQRVKDKRQQTNDKRQNTN